MKSLFFPLFVIILSMMISVHAYCQSENQPPIQEKIDKDSTTLAQVLPEAEDATVAHMDATLNSKDSIVVQNENQKSPTEKPNQDEVSSTSLTETLKETQPQFNISFAKIFWMILLILLGLIVIRFITRFVESLAERWTNLRLTLKGLVPIIRIFGWTILIYFIIAEVLAPPIQTLVAVTASAGIAVGFASQDILKNIFGGIMILFDRPFQVGDKIEVGKYYGEVVRIGLRTVRIVTPDDSLVSIPNSEIVNEAVSNANAGESNCQVVAEFYLPPDIDLISLKKIAYRAAAVSRYVYLNKPISTILKNEIHQGRSLLKLRLKAYVLDIRYEFPFMSEMTEIVMTELLKNKLVSPEQLSLIGIRNNEHIFN